MKTATLDSLITARALYDDARRLAAASDRHACTAALIQLQDALELILLAVLREREVDETKNIESKSFDELIGEVKKLGLAVPRSGTLKALNKQRVICKHYGQLAEPATVHQYFESSDLAIRSILTEVFSKPLSEIYLTELIAEGEAKIHLEKAAELIQKEKYLAALTAIRKAIFVEIEIDYCIHNYKDSDGSEQFFGLLLFGKGGHKAPYWTRNAEWIAKNVSCPTDYIQIDSERLRLDAMEWGVHTEELQNVRRLTPDVFRPEEESGWHIQVDLNFPKNQATCENATYCLDRAIDVILRKQRHSATRKWPSKEQPFDPPDVYVGDSLYSRATQESEILHTVSQDFSYTFWKAVSGFDPREKYYYLSGFKADPENSLGGEYVSGFMRLKDGES